MSSFFNKKKYFAKKKSFMGDEGGGDEGVVVKRKYLIIVESPSKCKKIEEFLGNEYRCIASKGHLREIKGLKSINTKGNFEIRFTMIKEKERHIEYMKQHIELYDHKNIFLGTDDDREGEAIAWHICEIFHLPVDSIRRITFNEITQNAIYSSLSLIQFINIHLVLAQHARQLLDLFVGFIISPFLWKLLFHDFTSPLSAGRCQTPALRLIYDNYKDMESSPGIDIKYKTTASFFSNNTIFTLNHEFDDEHALQSFLEKSKTANGFPYTLNIGQSKDCKCSPPKPLNTSQLLQKASSILRMSPKQTMQYCQQLYQDGHITYMRTENTKFSKEFLIKAKHYIENNYNSKYLGNIESLENKENANPHEGIRPTYLDTKFIKYEDTRINSLYQLIWKTTLESCMTDYKYKSVLLTIPAPDNLEYSHSIEIPVFLGFKIISQKEYTMTTSQTSETGNLLYYQSMNKNGFQYNYIQSNIKVNFKHNHYTEASLIHELETRGIGRPSTYSSIVSTIQERGYVTRCDTDGKTISCKEFRLESNTITHSVEDKVFGKERNKLVIQNLGILTIEFLLKHFAEIFAYEYTETMEKALDKIAQPELYPNEEILTWNTLCSQCYKKLKSLSKPISKLEKQLFKIDDEYDVLYISGKHVLRKTLEDGSIEFKSIKPTIKIDLEKLKNGEYTIDDLIELKNDCLGKYKDHNVYLKKGKYGSYIEWGENRASIKNITKPLDTIVFDDIIGHIYKHEEDNGIIKVDKPISGDDVRKPAEVQTTILRTIDDALSIRKGKYGPYIFYKTPFMKTPSFYNLTPKYKKNYATCSLEELKMFIREKYNIAMS
jgi:DNA topoisomerase-1